LQTRTRQRLIHYSARAGAKFSHRELVLKPYLVARYERRDREILPTEISTRLNEYYRWWEVGGGFSACDGLPRSFYSSLCFDFSWFRVTAAEVEVNLDVVKLGRPKLEMGSQSGFEVRVSWSPPQTSRIVAEAFFKRWSHGSSNVITVARGNSLFNIMEPASTTTIRGIGLSFRF
jgi:hypothetical protein